jgi:hypothetical protein
MLSEYVMHFCSYSFATWICELFDLKCEYGLLLDASGVFTEKIALIFKGLPQRYKFLIRQSPSGFYKKIFGAL